jgi:hypothetical protein
MATIKDKIGLAMIPSVYDGGISTSTTDFSGTVHSLLPIQHTGPNLVANGDFDQDSDWTKGTGWSISEGKAIHTGGTASYLSQDILEASKTYKVKIKVILADASNFVQIYMGNSPALELLNSPGEYTFTLKAQSSTTLGFAIRGVGEAEIDNVSVQLISNGDFDFERSSAATRVGSDGYIKNVEVLSDELVQNGDFEDAGSELVTYSDFSYGSGGWSLVDGKWTFDDAAAGYLNYPSISVTVGQIYKVVVDVSVPSGVANFRFSSGNAQTMLFDYTNFSDGITTFYTKVTGVNGGIQRLFAPTTLSDAFTLNSISIKEVGQNWTFGDGWSITDDGGNLKAIANNSPSGSRLSQFNLGQNINKKHRIYYTVSNLSQGGFNIWFGGITGNNITENGTYYQEITPTQTTQLFFYNIGTTTGQIDNISVVEITDDTDIPRLDYSDGAQPALLLEPQRSNLITYSDQPILGSGFSAVQNLTITQNATTSPDGTQNAMLVESTDTNSKLVVNSVDFVSGTTYTASVYIKDIDTTDFEILWYNASGTPQTQTDTFTDYKNNGWTRISSTFTATANDTGIDSQIQFARNLISGESLYMWGFQIEEGSYPTSYIPTKGSAVTRNADRCNNAGDSTIFNDDEGVLFLDIAGFENGGNDKILRLYSSSNLQEYVDIRLDELENRYQMVVRANGVNQTTGGQYALPQTDFNKIAVKYKENEFALWVNGDKIQTDSSGDTPTGLDTVNFEASLIGKVRSFLYFNEALTDAELEKLTSSNATQVLNNYSTLLTRVGATYESSGLETKLNELL